jgi:hypothetical protein
MHERVAASGDAMHGYDMLMTALALTTAAAPSPPTGGRVEAVARAVVVRGVAATPTAAVERRAAIVQVRTRRCEVVAPCRLIVTDLP